MHIVKLDHHTDADSIAYMDEKNVVAVLLTAEEISAIRNICYLDSTQTDEDLAIQFKLSDMLSEVRL